MNFKLTFFSIFVLSYLSILAQAPEGYYTTAEGKTSAALKSQLETIITANYNDVGYDGLYNIYKTSDILPNGKVWDMYSVKADGTANYYFNHTGNTCGSDGYKTEGDCFNREHTFCDSWLGGQTPQRSDAHHLVPTDGYVNNKRNNYPHGKVGSASWTSTNGSKLGNADASTDYSGTVFEPINEYKGDFARMYFYVATRYESKIAGWVNNGTANTILAGNEYPAYKTWFINLMLAWHRLDPVSTKEINRNNVIYTYQKNRNPYIDYPLLAEHIWGNLMGQPWATTPSNEPTILEPTNASSIDFSKVAYQQSKSMNLTLKAQNLTGNLTLAITGTNQSLFKLSKYTITKAEAEAGITIAASYEALNLGIHNATININGGGISNHSVQLKAESTDSFMALAASNISNSGFNANWTVSGAATGYLLNVYSLVPSGTGTATKLVESDFDNGLPTGWTSTGYVENQTASNMRLASGGNPGSIITPALNLSKPVQLTVKARQYNNDSGAKLTLSVDNVQQLSWNTTATNQIFTTTLPIQNVTAKISLSAVGGKRVYVDYFKAESLNQNYIETSVNGYPLNVGNVLTHQVTGLLANSTYYYKVSVKDNQSIVSSAIAVQTNMTTNLLKANKPSNTWTRTSTGITLNNLEPNSHIMVFDRNGQKIREITCNDSRTNITLNYNGLYFVNVVSNNNSQTIKVLY